MRLTPKMSDSPTATRNNEDASARPFRPCTIRVESVISAARYRKQSSRRSFGRGGSPLLDDFIRWQDRRAIHIADIGHDAFAVLHSPRTHVGGHGRLVVLRTIRDWPERRDDLQTTECLDQRLGIGGACCLEPFGQ